MANLTTLIIADDHPLILMGIKAEFANNEQFKILGIAHNGIEALNLIKNFSPQIAIIDMQMPQLNGIEVLKEVDRLKLPTKVVILTMFNDVALQRKAMECGAHGYLLKETVTDEIHTCMYEIKLGNLYVSINLSEKNDQFDFDFPEYDTLTRMEKKIFHLIQQSLTSKEIADELYLSIKTIENHRYNIGKKLNIEGGKSDILKFIIQRTNINLKP